VAPTDRRRLSPGGEEISAKKALSVCLGTLRAGRNHRYARRRYLSSTNLRGVSPPPLARARHAVVAAADSYLPSGSGRAGYCTWRHLQNRVCVSRRTHATHARPRTLRLPPAEDSGTLFSESNSTCLACGVRQLSTYRLFIIGNRRGAAPTMAQPGGSIRNDSSAHRRSMAGASYRHQPLLTIGARTWEISGRRRPPFARPVGIKHAVVGWATWRHTVTARALRAALF